VPNTGHYWKEAEKQDLLAMDRDSFLARYDWATDNAYRHKRRELVALVEQTSSIELDNGLFSPTPWNYAPQKASVPLGVEKHVMIGDTHGYFVDQRTWKAVLDFIRDFKPDVINCLGDLVDFYDISRYTKNPNRRAYLYDEIKFTREVVFAELRRAAPKARIVWKGGNHEDRLQRYLWSRAPELASLPALDMRNLFSLSSLNIQYTTDSLTVGDTELTHGHMARKHSGWTAKAMMEDLGTSVIHNHTHRLGAIYKSDRSGSYIAYENGSLCRLDPEFIHGTPNWQHGFSVGWLLPNGKFHTEQIAVQEGVFNYGGRFFGTDEQLDHCHD
jgi:hypothetical protein